MKHIKTILLISLLSIFAFSTQAQPWNSLLPKDKVENNSLTFLDIQKAFNDYWAPKNVVDGYYELNGVKTKAGGWKQFKRWEWYWENRVDPVTGEFPNTSAWEEYQKIKKATKETRSPSGQWTSMGPSTSPGGYAGLGRLNCIGFHPTDNNTYYCGAASGGVWKTTDGGTSWIVQGGDLDAIGISDIIVLSTSGDDEVYIATGDRDASDTYSIGVLKSLDGGSTWATTGLTFTAGQKRLINRLLIDTSNNTTLYAATSVGVYKSTDSGTNWSIISSNVYIDMEFQPGSSSTIYGSTKQGDIYRSTDSGSNWTNSLSTSGKRTELAVSVDDATVVYALIAASNSGLFGIYKSTDSGASFSSIYSGGNLLGWNCTASGSGGQGWYDLCIAADPANVNTVFLGGVNTWKSTDGGTTWNINNHWWSTCSGNATPVHADKHNLAFQNGTSTLFECNDGGLYTTSDLGSNWTHLSDGMVISQMYRLGVAQTTTSDVITGLQDNGTKALLTSVWTDVIGGDGMECLIDYSNENTQYGSLYYGDIYRTTNHWVSSTNISGGISGNAAWVTPYLQDPNNSNTLFVGYQDVWKSTNQGGSWTQLSTWGGGTLRSLAVAPSNSSYIYAATTGTIYGTSNGGSSWNNITGSLPTGSSNITYISVKDDDPNTLWVSMGEFNSNCVFESTNGGSTWTDISAGLPDLPTNCVIQNRQNTSLVELYAATDVGVYLKLGSANWTQFYDGMPNVVVTELDIYYDDVTTSNSLIRAATYGRGLWESDLYSAFPAPTADFEGTPTTGDAPLMVAFTDLSVDSVNTWLWDFGDGGSSTDQNPSHEYVNPGDFTVSLTVTGPGGSDTIVKTNYITASYPAPTADFEGTPTSGDIPLMVAFTDLSVDSVDTWLWDFGDTGSSTDQNPSHEYTSPGDFTVSLTVTGPGGNDTIVKTNYITATYAAPNADFEGTPLAGDAPLTVAFTDLSVDSVNTWLWDFGDGGSSSDQNPSHEYVNPGDYSVTLTVTGPGGSDTLVKTNYITATYPEPTSDFEGTPTIGNAPLEVTFTDLSVDSVDSWVWDFGDGGTSNLQNPVYTYVDAGTYDVSLTVSGPGGSDDMVKVDYISVFINAPIADFVGAPTAGNAPLMVNFTDLSTGSIDGWSWDFGDSGTSSDQNPSHEYLSSGNFTVSLTVTGPGGSTTEIKTDYILIPVDVGENEADIILVYPNPVSDNLHIIFPDAKNRILTLNNLNGDRLLVHKTSGSEELINMSQFPNGVYSLTIQDSGLVSILKIVKK